MNEFLVGSTQTTRQRTKGRGLLIVATVALLTIWSVRRPGGAPPGWGADLDAGIKQAVAERKNLLVAFHSDGCPPCWSMDKVVLRTDVIKKAITNFVPVRVDVLKTPEVAARFSMHGTPTYMIFAPDGKLLAQTAGYQDEEDLLRFLQSVTAGK